MEKKWTGDWKLIREIRERNRLKELLRPSEPINHSYPLNEKIDLPSTYKSSDGKSRAIVSGEIEKAK